MNVTLTSELEKLVKEKVERGDYETADALVRLFNGSSRRTSNGVRLCGATFKTALTRSTAVNIPSTTSTPSRKWPRRFTSAG